MKNGYYLAQSASLGAIYWLHFLKSVVVSFSIPSYSDMLSSSDSVFEIMNGRPIIVSFCMKTVLKASPTTSGLSMHCKKLVIDERTAKTGLCFTTKKSIMKSREQRFTSFAEVFTKSCDKASYKQGGIYYGLQRLRD